MQHAGIASATASANGFTFEGAQEIFIDMRLVPLLGVIKRVDPVD
jgi:hypothetical protein